MISTIKHVPILMKTKQCKMKQGCCLVTFCPLVPSWATMIHKFQGFEARFDKNDQFQHVCVFLASGYRWVTVMHEIPISSAHLLTSLPYPRTW